MINVLSVLKVVLLVHLLHNVRAVLMVIFLNRLMVNQLVIASHVPLVHFVLHALSLQTNVHLVLMDTPLNTQNVFHKQELISF